MFQAGEIILSGYKRIGSCFVWFFWSYCNILK